MKTIEWEFGNSPHTGNDVIVRLRFTLNSGHQSPVFGLPKAEKFPCKFDFKKDQKISSIKVYCYGCYGFEFFDHKDQLILKIGKTAKDFKELKLENG